MGKLITFEAGNSSIKLGMFDPEGTLLQTETTGHTGLARLIADFVIPGIKVACAATADASIEQQMIDMLSDAGAEVHWFHSGGVWPVPIAYQTPETLGSDRMLHAIAVSWLSKGQAAIVICCGTALVVDLVAPDGTFLGGSISPGLDMRFRALHTFTGRLPYIQEWNDDVVPDVGTDTVGSLLSGVINGMTDEINQRVDRYKKMFSAETMVFLTGGSAPRLANHLRNINFADPHLIHRGLFRAVQLQAST